MMKQATTGDSMTDLAPISRTDDPFRCDVLILDDNKVDRVILRREIARLPYECSVTEADTLPRFCKLVDERSFDLILIDYLLGADIGLDAIAYSRATPTNRDAYHVMVSGCAYSQLPVSAVRAGFREFLSKTELANGLLLDLILEAMQESLARAGGKDAVQSAPGVAIFSGGAV